MASVVIRHLNDLLGRILKGRAAQSGRTIEEEGRGILVAALTEEPAPERQRQAVARRLNRLLHLLNAARHAYSFNVPEMASYLRLNSASELESYFLGESEAPFDLLDQIAVAFGVRPDWLKFGHGKEPFYLNNHSLGLNRAAFIEQIRALKPQAIYFVRSLNEEGYATIVFRMSEWRYEGTYDDWNVSGHVGGTGHRQLFQLWKLLKAMDKDLDLMRITYGRDLPPDLYLSLRRGEVYPGAVLDQPNRYRSNWHDDFIDIDHKQPIATHGYAHYGEAFVKAQALVRQSRDFQQEDARKVSAKIE